MLKRKKRNQFKKLSKNNTDMKNRLVVTRGQGVGWGGRNKVRLKLKKGSMRESLYGDGTVLYLVVES